MLRFVIKSHLMQYEKYINKLKKFELYQKSKSYYLSIPIYFRKLYNFLIYMIKIIL